MLSADVCSGAEKWPAGTRKGGPSNAHGSSAYLESWKDSGQRPPWCVESTQVLMGKEAPSPFSPDLSSWVLTLHLARSELAWITVFGTSQSNLGSV